MSKNINQKQKLLYIKQMLEEETDEEHGLTVSDMIERLKKYGIETERKSIYDDIDCLRNFGMDIQLKRGRRFMYYLGNRPFEMAELKILVDGVQVIKTLSDEQSRQLIGKIEKLVSVHQARKLSRHIFLQGRVKTVNEEIYQIIDAIHRAISENKQIRFRYFDVLGKKKKQFRKNGEFYEMSPWSLTFSEERYYLVAYDGDVGMIKHFRIDKMLNVTNIDKDREGQKHYSDFQIDLYSNRMFGMYGGEERRVTLYCDESLAGAMIDRFGESVLMIPDEGGFRITISVVISPRFYSWLFGFGTKVRIIAPQDVREKFCQEMIKNLKQYHD